MEKTIFDKPKLTPPNDKGFQFGLCESLTKYAQKDDPVTGMPGVKLTIVEVWKDDRRVAYLFQNEKGEVVAEETHGLEAAACKIDAFRALKRFEEDD